jgi:glycyl-tRNA synthetase beta chain
LIALWVPHADILEVEVAAKLCKADLTTEMVGEFPELQGIVGYYYAMTQGYSENIALAIKEHYLPQGGSELPHNPVSICLALADKLDNLVSLFAIGERPTGSKDPYAIRRQAIGIIRIILEGKISFPFNLALEKAVQPYAGLVKARHKKKLKGFFVDHNRDVAREVLDFVFERLSVILKEQGLTDDVINAVYNEGVADDFLVLKERAVILQERLKEKKTQEIMGAYKRAYNIYSKQKEGCDYKNKKPHKLVFKCDAEKELYRVIKSIKQDSNLLLKEEGYEAALDYLEVIVAPVNNFFDKVKVNDDDAGIKENRLKLLAYLCGNVNRIANFSYIESQLTQ